MRVAIPIGLPALLRRKRPRRSSGRVKRCWLPCRRRPESSSESITSKLSPRQRAVPIGAPGEAGQPGNISAGYFLQEVSRHASPSCWTVSPRATRWKVYVGAAAPGTGNKDTCPHLSPIGRPYKAVLSLAKSVGKGASTISLRLNRQHPAWPQQDGAEQSGIHER
jgi:hypothetical protein